MAEIGKRIKEKREAIDMTQEELAERLGYKNKSSIAKIESGTNDIAQSKVIEFADILHTSVSYLMGWEDEQSPYIRGFRINVLSRVAADLPIEAVTDIIDTEEISEEMARTGEFFGLRIHDDSMEPRMYDGDIVIVRKQEDAVSGEIVIARVNDDDAVCKRLLKYAGGIGLISLNSKYDPLMFSQQDIEDKTVRILGKVVEARKKF